MTNAHNVLRANAHPDHSGRYAAKHREPTQQLQDQGKLLRSSSAERTAHNSILREKLGTLRQPRRQLTSPLNLR